MSTQSKKKQRISDYPTGITNPLPTISNNSNKKLQHNLEEGAGILLPHLKQEMEYKMRRKIKVCIEININIGELKQNCQSLKQLEKGLATDVERKSNLPATTIQNFLLRYNNNIKTNLGNMSNSSARFKSLFNYLLLVLLILYLALRREREKRKFLE